MKAYTAENIRVVRATQTSIELMWDDASKSPHKYTVEVKERNIKTFRKVYTGYSGHHVFTGLDPNTTYVYRVHRDNEPSNGEMEVTTSAPACSSEQLHQAVERNDTNLMSALLQEARHELLDAPDAYGNTLLMNAASRGNAEIVKMLLTAGADVNFVNGSGKSVFAVACSAGHLNVVKVIYALRDVIVPSSALHWSVDGGCVELIDWLCKHGVEVDGVDLSGWTPLMRVASTSGDPRIAGILVSRGADVNRCWLGNRSPLMTAAMNGHRGLVELLLKRGANVSIRTERNKSAVDFARSFEHHDIAAVLDEKQQDFVAEEKAAIMS